MICFPAGWRGWALPRPSTTTCGEGAEVGAQTPLAVHHAGTYPKQLRRAYSSSGPSCQLVGAKGRAASISLPKGDV